MRNWKQKIIILILLLLALLLLPFLIPTQSYIHEIEQLVTDKLKVPLTIGSMKVALLPTPRINLSNVNLGNDHEFVAKDVAVIPSLLSLLSDHKVISLVVVDEPVIKKGALDFVSALAASKEPEDSASKVVIRHIKIKQAKLDWSSVDIPVLNADVKFTDKNQLESAQLTSLDKHLNLVVTLKDNQPYLVLNADHWTLPVAYPFLFDHLQGTAILRDDHLEINALDGKLYRGELHYNGTLSWQNNWQAEGKFTIHELSLREPLALISPNARLSGVLSGDGHFSAYAKTAAQLSDAIKLHFDFHVNDGVLYGFDLVKAATSLITRDKQGGETKFDELSGVMDRAGKQTQLSQLKVSSGLLAANGKVTISPAKTLDGVVNVQIKNSMAVTEVPLAVSGSLEHPVVLPTKAALAGAAVGTAVLGPGVGTSVGIKASGAVDKIKEFFGGGDKARDKFKDKTKSK